MTTTDEAAGIRARTVAEIRIPATIEALEAARKHLIQIPVTYDVQGQCLNQALDDVIDAVRKLKRMHEAMEERY